MKKSLIVLAIILLTGCADMDAAASGAGSAASVTGTPAPTATPTVDWQGTAQVAQATADEARRVNAAATAEHESYLAVAIEGTRSANELEMARVWQTATYAPTAVALELTRTAGNIAVAEMRLQQIKIEATATQGAPALLRAQKDAEAYNADLAFGMETFMQFSTGFLMLALPILMWVGWKKQPAPARPAAPLPTPAAPSANFETAEQAVTVHIHKDEDGYPSMRRVVAPCSAEMLTEFADGILSDEKTTRFEFWEGSGSKWTRPLYRRFRVWLLDMKYALNNNGEIVLLDEGLAFLRGWLETQRLPERFDFGLTDETIATSASDVMVN